MSLLKTLWVKSPKDVLKIISNKVIRSTPTPQWTDVISGPFKGGKLFLDIHSFHGWHEMINGTFDSFIYDELDNHCEVTGSVVWDIGAHFGYHSFSFASLIGDKGHVYAFEPNPSNISRFKMHMKKNSDQAKRISLNMFALSDKNGEEVFIFSDDVDGSCSSGSHLQGVNTPLESNAYASFNEQIVKTLTIDDLLKESNIRIPQLIKIDVEGAEMCVLRGGKQLFTKYRPIVFMEVHNILMMFYVQDYFIKLGYSIRILDEKNATTSKCFIMAVSG